jgi:hypothetical protein
VIVYVVVAVGETDFVPLVATVPILLSMDADVAFVELQVRVADWPFVIDAGETVNVTVGAGVGGGVTTLPLLVPQELKPARRVMARTTNKKPLLFILFPLFNAGENLPATMNIALNI